MIWEFLKGIDWELLLKAIAIVVGFIVSIYKGRQLLPKSRTRLKTDIEIFKLLEPSDQNYQIVKSYINRTVRNIYTAAGFQEKDTSKRFHIYNWGELIGGIIFMTVFASWTVYIVKDGFRWWSLLTGFFALAGWGMMMSSLEPPRSIDDNT